MYFKGGLAFYLLAIVAVVIFFIGAINRVLIWRLGKAPSFKHPISRGEIAKGFILNGLLQARLFGISKFRWFMHACIAFGFFGLLVHTTWLAFLEWIVGEESSLTQYFFHGAGRWFLDAWGDFWGTLLLLGLVIALVRRYVTRSEQLETVTTDTVALVFLTLVVLTGFLAEGARLNASQIGPKVVYSFAGCVTAAILKGVGLNPLPIRPVQWTHAIISLVFVAYLPYGKFLHVVAGPLSASFDASDELARKKEHHD